MSSPSTDVDSSWSPIKSCIENDMKVKHTDDGPIYFDHYDAEALHEILDTQHTIPAYKKEISKINCKN